MPYFTIGDCFLLPNKGHDALQQDSLKGYAVGVVCDGVSSSIEPEFGAKSASNVLFNGIKEHLLEDLNPCYSSLYEQAFNSLLKQRGNSAYKNSGQSLFATTAIIAVVSDNQAEFSYVGNGAIFEIRFDWFALPFNLPTPWGVSNYLNPHSQYIDGQNRLTHTLQARAGYSGWKPDVISLRSGHKKLSYFLICTDGLYSSDEVATAWGPDKDYYIFESRRLLILLELLRQYHESGWIERSTFCDQFHKRLESEQLISDDLSFILFVPES